MRASKNSSDHGIGFSSVNSTIPPWGSATSSRTVVSSSESKPTTWPSTNPSWVVETSTRPSSSSRRRSGVSRGCRPCVNANWDYLWTPRCWSHQECERQSQSERRNRSSRHWVSAGLARFRFRSRRLGRWNRSRSLWYDPVGCLRISGCSRWSVRRVTHQLGRLESPRTGPRRGPRERPVQRQRRSRSDRRTPPGGAARQ